MINVNYYKLLAKKVPTQVRELKILTEENPVYTATANKSDKNMMMLAKVWYEFIEPNAERNYNCNICMNNILNGWKELFPALKELSIEHKLLESL